MGILHEARVFFVGEKPSTKEERRLLLKIDTCILGFVCLSQFVNYLDRANLANAYVSRDESVSPCCRAAARYKLVHTLIRIDRSGMQEEVGFVGTQYNQAVSIFTDRRDPERTHRLEQQDPIVLLVPVLLYDVSELGKRACLVTAASNGGTLIAECEPAIRFSGVLQAGIQSTLNGRLGLSGWRWLFIIDALITAPVWILGFLTFPDTPTNTRAFYISESERAQAIERLPPHEPTKLDWGVFWKVGKDWRFYAFTIMFSINTNMEFCGLYSIMSLWMKWTKEYTVQQINYYPLGTTAVTIATTCLFALCSPHARPYLLSPECTVKDADAAHAVGTDYTKSRWWVNLVMPVCVWDIPLGAKFFAYYFAGMGYIGQAVNFSWANEVCRDDDQLRSLTLYSMVYGSNVTIAWFNIVSGEWRVAQTTCFSESQVHAQDHDHDLSERKSAHAHAGTSASTSTSTRIQHASLSRWGLQYPLGALPCHGCTSVPQRSDRNDASQRYDASPIAHLRILQ
ncbi:hypothetical protein JCM24511_02531 [Saitozyma sp. JCM 24511]|nr:hypothetical protein JCM24511_02531 [Saitozyma sp. JCM 24511]